ncbi:MAG: 2-oxoglutarate dehydrogenase E1 component [Calditrichia bacterium]
MPDLSYISNAHPRYVEALYQSYLENPESVEPGWRRFFDGYELGKTDGGVREALPVEVQKEFKVLNLIHGYRTRGHLFTQTNPVRTRRKYLPTLDLENFGLSEADLDTVFQAGEEIGIGPAPLREIVEHLKQTYCRSIGAEFMFIRDPALVWWLKTKMESSKNIPQFSLEEKRHILKKLNQAVVFEKFLHTKYVGQKRFSLQGGETLIPGLDAIIQKGAEKGIAEFVIGMPHRGRLNVLANILNKSYEEIFSEFEGDDFADSIFSGDVKYHLGYSNTIKTRSGQNVNVTLSPNPSHLEGVSPVVLGTTRAKMDKLYNGDYTRVAPILIHGDAAIAGQGVVYEVIQMSQLPAYHTGGTIHMVVNNQLGFTTNYLEARSSTYCTDVAKVTLSPVFHVNADDVEAVVLAIQIAMEYRQLFHTDVFIDLLGYRKYGHNEGDEPRFTQPKLYKLIARHPDPREIYNRKLLQSNEVERGLAEEMEEEFKNELQAKLEMTRKNGKKQKPSTVKQETCSESERPKQFDFEKTIKTGVNARKLKELAEKIFSIPDEVKAFRKVRQLYDNRREKFLKEKKADWAIGEALAYASLLEEDVSVRLCGQDTERGTFSHRHGVVYNEETEERYIPLKNCETGKSRFHIYNSLLSEYAALGFEYGYACATPDGLTIWEAQFGDFANGAQIIFDQFISSAEAKWKRMNGIVLYLPHGYEGQGPEHSSARIERYLELCANNNMMVANCSTPANLFHLLRRHMSLPFRLPLILFTPKSLLRHPECVSTAEEFTRGRFLPVIDDGDVMPENVKRVVFCSGKFYYDLLAKRRELKRDNPALVRVEQLYPVPEKSIRAIYDKYSHAEFYWAQEEPENMGALPFYLRKWPVDHIRWIARPENSTPATGYFKHHLEEHEELFKKVFE